MKKRVIRKEIINEEKANNKKQRVTYDAQRVIAKSLACQGVYFDFG